MFKHVFAAVVILGMAASARAESHLAGAGSSFDAPAFQQWFSEYGKRHEGPSFTYDPVGSGAGVKKLIARAVDFGASDAPLTDAEVAKNPTVVNVPIVVGAVSVAFNLPGVTELKLSPATVSGIFLGQIKLWSDPAIAADNAGVDLPKTPITVVHRSDGSGTTAIFTDYLSKVAPAWKSGPGQGESVTWKTGTGAKGSDAVVKAIAAKPGAIGYVDLAHANLANLPSAAIKNAAGAYVQPSIMSASSAASSAKLPADLRGSITNPPGDDAYPIAGFSYLVIQNSQPDAAKGAELAKFFSWVVNEGQGFSSPLDYAPLPGPVVARANVILQRLGADVR